MIWIDEFIHNDENQVYKETFEEKFKEIKLVCAETIEEGINMIN